MQLSTIYEMDQAEGIVDKSKIQREELTPSKIELLLRSVHGQPYIDTELIFEEKNRRGIQIRTIAQTSLPRETTEDEARKAFEDYKDKFAKGEYTLHISYDGKSKIEWN